METLPRESIFKSSIRKLFSVFAGVFGFLIALFLGVLLFSTVGSKSTTGEKATVNISPNEDGDTTMLSIKSPLLLRIDIHDVIGTKKNNHKLIRSILNTTKNNPYFAHDRLKGILLHIDSPGGASFDSYEIYRMITEFKKENKIPVYAYIDGMCASGGMMIACAADKILSPEVGIIGSVGVLLGPAFNFSGLMDKYGLSATTLTRGKDKDSLNPTKPVDPKSLEPLERLIDHEYAVFLDIVSSNRPLLSKSKLINVYGARVYNPSDAMRYGYIDSDSASYSAALKELREEAKIQDEDNYQVVTVQIQRNLVNDFFDASSENHLFSKTVKHELALPSRYSKELEGKVLYLYEPNENAIHH